MQPTIAIVIPCYNAERFLSRTLDSALRQTCPAHEVIVVDDGSTDNSRAIAEAFGPPVRVLTQKNLGAGAARLAGARASQSDLVAFNDADDPMPWRKLEALSAALRAHPQCVAALGCVVDTRLGRPALPAWCGGKLDGRCEVLDDPLRELLAGGAPLAQAMNLMARRAALLDCVGERRFYPAANDFDLQLRLATRGAFVRVAAVTGTYIRHAAGITATQGRARQRAYALLAGRSVLREHYRPDWQQAWKERLQQDWARIFVGLCAGRQGALAARVLALAWRYTAWRSWSRQFWWALEAHAQREAAGGWLAPLVGGVQWLRGHAKGSDHIQRGTPQPVASIWERTNNSTAPRS